MSRKLALSSALSVIMMAGFVLFGTPASASVDGHGLFANPAKVSMPALPTAGSILPSLR